MKLPNNLGLKAYLTIFTVFSLGTLASLSSPDGNTYVYYNTLVRFHHPALIWYIFAALDAVLGCLSAIPLALRAFEKPVVWASLFQIFFFLRLLTTVLGHNYEWIILKSAFIGTPNIGWLTLLVWGIFTFPSFKEHYIYAFHPSQNRGRSPILTS